MKQPKQPKRLGQPKQLGRLSELIRRAGAALAASALGSVLLTGCATEAVAQGGSQDPLFDPADAQDLADLLADATAAQHVCYGWNVEVTDSAGPTLQSTGSNFGPGQSLGSAGGTCQARVEFTADITYTSDSSDYEDYASWSVTSWPGSGPYTGDLDQLNVVTESELVGDDADVAVARAVAALPQLAAEAGIAPPLTATPAGTVPPGIGALDDQPGSDYLRRAGGLLGFGAVLLIGGLAFGLFALRTARSRRSPPPPPSPTSSPPSS